MPVQLQIPEKSDSQSTYQKFCKHFTYCIAQHELTTLQFLLDLALECIIEVRKFFYYIEQTRMTGV